MLAVKKANDTSPWKLEIEDLYGNKFFWNVL